MVRDGPWECACDDAVEVFEQRGLFGLCTGPIGDGQSGAGAGSRTFGGDRLVAGQLAEAEEKSVRGWFHLTSFAGTVPPGAVPVFYLIVNHFEGVTCAPTEGNVISFFLSE